MKLDYPISDFAWDYLATTRPLAALMDWGYTWGGGPNLRALFIHGLIGGAQWFLLGAVAGFFFWPRKGYIARGDDMLSNPLLNPDARPASHFAASLSVTRRITQCWSA